MKVKLYLYLLVIAILSSCDTSDDSSSTENNIADEFANELEAVKTFGGSQQDDALSVVATADGNLAILGFTQSNDGDVEGKLSTDSDYWLLKLDQDLNILWQKTYGGSSDDRGQSIITTSDGGFLITGFSRSNDGDVTNNSGFHDFWALKLSSGGDMIWEKSFGFSGNDRSHSVIETIDGGFFITGFLDVSASDGAGNDNGEAEQKMTIFEKHGVGEFWGVKINRFGQTEWRRYFGGSNNDRAYDVIETSDGSLIMVGNSESNDFDITNPQGSYDFWAVKIDLQGNLLWQKNFGGSSIDIAYSVVGSSDGNFIIAGDTRSSDGDVTNFKGNTDYWAVKFDNLGNKIWQYTYGGSDFESARDIIQLQNGNYLVCGSSKSQDMDVAGNFGQNDVWTITIDEAGNLINENNFGGSGLDFSQSAVQLQNGKVVVVGSSESNDNQIPENKGDKDVLVLILK
jgi:hypothetical protein